MNRRQNIQSSNTHSFICLKFLMHLLVSLLLTFLLMWISHGLNIDQNAYCFLLSACHSLWIKKMNKTWTFTDQGLNVFERLNASGLVFEYVFGCCATNMHWSIQGHFTRWHMSKKICRGKFCTQPHDKIGWWTKYALQPRH